MKTKEKGRKTDGLEERNPLTLASALAVPQQMWMNHQPAAALSLELGKELKNKDTKK